MSPPRAARRALLTVLLWAGFWAVALTVVGGLALGPWVYRTRASVAAAVDALVERLASGARTEADYRAWCREVEPVAA